ncbi:MAG: DHH family protein [Clostridia bacterium]|nr:DHH family protein [Clostridia bacterium]
MNKNNDKHIIITAGSNYLDIDAYACMVAMAEVLKLQGVDAVAYSKAPCNYSVCEYLVEDGQVIKTLPFDACDENLQYIIVDVSDPDFIKESAPLDRVIEVYDHHVGFENFWGNRIGDNAHIEFIGAAATLIYRQWEKSGLQDKMKSSTAKLLIAAILDNTLNLTSTNTTPEDVEVFNRLCAIANVEKEWCASYFSEVQKNVEADLKNAMLKDVKAVRNNPVLPPKVAQLCVWDANSILARLDEIRGWFADDETYMINFIDLKQSCSYFLCEDETSQKKIEKVFNVQFENSIAKTEKPYLRKQILKNVLNSI